MLLALSVISQNAAALGPGSYKVFDERGGTIGRIGGNDWILPDPDKFVSSRHATIHCDNGQFFLQDTSTNGTFLNAPDHPVARDQPLGLSDGDRLFIGEYEILVQLIEDAVSPEPVAAEPEPALAREYAPGPSSVAVHHPFAAAPGETLEEQAYEPMRAQPMDAPFAPMNAPMSSTFDTPFETPIADDPLADFAPAEADPFQEPLRASPPQPQPIARPGAPAARMPPPAAAQAPGQIPTDYQITGFRTSQGPATLPHTAPRERPGAQPRVAPGASPPPQHPDAVDPLAGLPAQRRDPPARAAPPPPPPRPTPSAGATAYRPAPQPPPRAVPPSAPIAPARPAASLPTDANQAGGADLLAAMGLDPSHVDPAVFEQLGTIVRMVVQGLIEVLQSRAEIKNNFRMPMTSIRPVENNPLKFSMNADDALHNLFVKRNPGYLAPVESFQEAFQDVAFHQLAMLAGVRAAYDAMLAKLHPGRLEEIFERKLKRAASMFNKQSRFWDLYREQFEDIDRDAEAHFQMLFGEEFAKAYNDQLQRLNAAARARHR